MNKAVLNKLLFFERVKVPKYIETKIQKIALTNLGLLDMGKLRDRFDGQVYYEKLKTDIIAEISFEKLLGYQRFDWSKREVKNYKRKYYIINDKEVVINAFTNNELPKIELDNITNTVFVYVNIDHRVFISGLATKCKLQEILLSNNNKSQDFSDFENLESFSSIEQLIKLLD